MIHIISKASLCQQSLEKFIAVLQNCYKWLKLTKDSGFSRLRTMRWVFSNDPNNSIKGLTRFLWHSWERYEPFQKSRTEFSWKYNAQHAQRLDQERAARNSRKLGNSLTKSYADFYVDVLVIFYKIIAEPTMDFRSREALFFGDNFFKLVTIGFKFSHHPFQPKRRYPSIWSLNKI